MRSDNLEDKMRDFGIGFKEKPWKPAKGELWLCDHRLRQMTTTIETKCYNCNKKVWVIVRFKGDGEYIKENLPRLQGTFCPHCNISSTRLVLYWYWGDMKYYELEEDDKVCDIYARF